MAALEQASAGKPLPEFPVLPHEPSLVLVPELSLVLQSLPVPPPEPLPMLPREPSPALPQELLVPPQPLPVLPQEPLPVLPREPSPVLPQELWQALPREAFPARGR